MWHASEPDFITVKMSRILIRVPKKGEEMWLSCPHCVNTFVKVPQVVVSRSAILKAKMKHWEEHHADKPREDLFAKGFTTGSVHAEKSRIKNSMPGINLSIARTLMRLRAGEHNGHMPAMFGVRSTDPGPGSDQDPEGDPELRLLQGEASDDWMLQVQIGGPLRQIVKQAVCWRSRQGHRRRKGSSSKPCGDPPQDGDRRRERGVQARD